MLHAFPKHSPIYLARVNQMNTHTMMFFPTSNFEQVSHNRGYYFAFINFIYMEFLPGFLQKPPSWGNTILGVQSHLQPIKIVVSKTYRLWSFIT